MDPMIAGVRKFAAVLGMIAGVAAMPMPCFCPAAPVGAHASEHACCAPPIGVRAASEGCCETPRVDAVPTVSAAPVVGALCVSRLVMQPFALRSVLAVRTPLLAPSPPSVLRI